MFTFFTSSQTLVKDSSRSDRLNEKAIEWKSHKFNNPDYYPTIFVVQDYGYDEGDLFLNGYELGKSNNITLTSNQCISLTLQSDYEECDDIEDYPPMVAFEYLIEKIRRIENYNPALKVLLDLSRTGGYGDLLFFEFIE